MTKRLTIRIRSDGSIEAETHGMTGSECLPYIDTLERLTDSETVDSWFTAEFAETERHQAATLRDSSRQQSLDDRG